MPPPPKAVLITGASRRIGFALVKESLALGLAVVAHYRSSANPLAAWLRRHPESAARVFLIRGELTNEPEEIVRQARGLPLRLVGLVNNAASFDPGDLRDSDNLMATLSNNALAPYRLARAFGQDRHAAWIINITDAHISAMNRRYQNYRISKKLLEELTRQLAFVLAPAIRVNALAPGAMLPAASERGGQFERLKESIPLARTGDLASLLKAYRFLIEADYVTGQTICVDGGWHLVG